DCHPSSDASRQQPVLDRERAALNTASGKVASCTSCGLVQALRDPFASADCRRCGATVHFRKPNQENRVWALVIAASILYIPANILPVMRIRTVASDDVHTILGGVIELWQLGSWDLAVIVFV